MHRSLKELACFGSSAIYPESSYQYQLLKQRLALQQETELRSELAAIFVARGLPKEIAKNPTLAETFVNYEGVAYLGKRGRKLNFLVWKGQPGGTPGSFADRIVGPVKHLELSRDWRNMILYGTRGYERISYESLLRLERGGPPYLHTHITIRAIPTGHVEAHVFSAGQIGGIIPPKFVFSSELEAFIKDYAIAILPTGEIVPTKQLFKILGRPIK